MFFCLSIFFLSCSAFLIAMIILAFRVYRNLQADEPRFPKPKPSRQDYARRLEEHQDREAFTSDPNN